MDFAHGEPVDVLSAGTTTDPYSGEPVASWDTPTTVTVEHVAVAAGGSLEPLQDARNSVTSDFDLIFPPDAAVASTSRVVVRGLVCDVVGRPFLWRSPFTDWAPGLVVNAKITEG